MEWIENEDLNNDRCSTSSSSQSIEPNGEGVSQTAALSMKCKTSQFDQNGIGSNGNMSANQDSMSDGELSDYSLNDSDDEEYRSSAEHNNGKNFIQMKNNKNLSAKNKK